MAKIAMKFGGTSVADLDRVRHVATLVKKERDRGNEVAVVVSAMADTTTATSCPASTSRLTWRATLRIRSILATDVPPNFITRRPMTTRAFPMRISKLARTENGAPGPKAAYT